MIMAAVPALGEGQGLPLQDCHKVRLTKHDQSQDNKSVIRVWSADTAHDGVDAELAEITGSLALSEGAGLPAAGNKTDKNSRLDVEIRYSRTGMSWMSFLIQARRTYHRALTGQKIVSRTYDMETGERILLSDLFPEDSPAWDALSEKARETISAYFPDEEPDGETLARATAPDALRDADFTLHGMSLVLHYPAEDFYPTHFTLIEVTLMYPEIRGWMTEEALRQTDNASYYKFAAFTFDDGPARTNSTLVLQNLMTAGIRGTFFVIGNRISQYADLVQREHDEGHSVAAHNWHHGNVKKSSASALRQMPQKVDKAMTAAIGIPAPYDRVPYGLYNQMIKAKVGWAYIQWSLDTYDWRKLPTAKVVSRIKAQLSDGDIILMHDIKDNTPDSVLQAAEWMQENGYMLLTVDELFAKDGIELKPNTVYWHNADGDTGLKKN